MKKDGWKVVLMGVVSAAATLAAMATFVPVRAEAEVQQEAPSRAKPPVLLSRSTIGTTERTEPTIPARKCWETMHTRVQWKRIAREHKYAKERTRETFAEAPRLTKEWRNGAVQRAITPVMLRRIDASLRGDERVKLDADVELSDSEKRLAYRLRTEYGITVVGHSYDSHELEPFETIDIHDALLDLEILQEERKIRTRGAMQTVTKVTLWELLEGHAAVFCRHRIIRKRK